MLAAAIIATGLTIAVLLLIVGEVSDLDAVRVIGFLSLMASAFGAVGLGLFTIWSAALA